MKGKTPPCILRRQAERMRHVRCIRGTTRIDKVCATDTKQRLNYSQHPRLRWSFCVWRHGAQLLTKTQRTRATNNAHERAWPTTGNQQFRLSRNPNRGSHANLHNWTSTAPSCCSVQGPNGVGARPLCKWSCICPLLIVVYTLHEPLFALCTSHVFSVDHIFV